MSRAGDGPGRARRGRRAAAALGPSCAWWLRPGESWKPQAPLPFFRKGPLTLRRNGTQTARWGTASPKMTKGPGRGRTAGERRFQVCRASPGRQASVQGASHQVGRLPPSWGGAPDLQEDKEAWQGPSGVGVRRGQDRDCGCESSCHRAVPTVLAGPVPTGHPKGAR